MVDRLAKTLNLLRMHDVIIKDQEARGFIE